MLLEYAKDVREAVISLAQGNFFSEARRIVSAHTCSHTHSHAQYHLTITE